MRKFLFRFRKFLPSWAEQQIDRIENSPTGKRLASGVFWSLSGNIVARMFSFAGTIIVTRILGKELYGQVGTIQSTLDTFISFAGLGLSLTATKHVAEYTKSDPARAGRIIAMISVVSSISGGLMAIVLFFWAPVIAQLSFGEPALAALLRIAAPILLFSTLNAAQTATLTGFEAFRVRATITVWSSIIGVPISVAGVYFAGKTGAVCALLANAIIIWAINFVSLRKVATSVGVKLLWAGWYKEARLIAKFSLPALACSLVITPVGWICSTMVARTPGGFAELGIYNAANQWFSLIMFIPGIVSVVAVPVLSDLVSQEKWDSVLRILFTSVRAHCIVVIPAVILCAASPWIMRMYGTGFSSGSITMCITVTSAIFVTLHTPIWPVLIAANRVYPLLLMNIGWSVVFIIGTRLLLPFGSIGLASAQLIAYICHFTWMFIYTWKLLSRLYRARLEAGTATLGDSEPTTTSRK